MHVDELHPNPATAGVVSDEIGSFEQNLASLSSCLNRGVEFRSLLLLLLLLLIVAECPSLVPVHLALEPANASMASPPTKEMAQPKSGCIFERRSSWLVILTD